MSDASAALDGPSESEDHSRSLAGVYLREALAAVDATGRSFGDPAFEVGRGTGERVAIALYDAALEQLASVRKAVLFSAMAAEAYVNAFLASTCLARI